MSNSLEELNIQFSNISSCHKCKMPAVFNQIHANIIPKFNGTPKDLKSFLEAVNEVLELCYDPSDPTKPQNRLIRSTILSKLQGNAKDVVSRLTHPTLAQIREVLLQNFSDTRDGISLIYDLNNLRQEPNETPYEFYDKIFEFITLYDNYINLHKESQSVIRELRDQFAKNALKVFMAGLRQPYGTMIRSNKPTSLLAAYKFIREEEAIQTRSHDSMSSSSIQEEPKTVTTKPTSQAKTSQGQYSQSATQCAWAPACHQHIQQPSQQHSFYQMQPPLRGPIQQTGPTRPQVVNLITTVHGRRTNWRQQRYLPIPPSAPGTPVPLPDSSFISCIYSDQPHDLDQHHQIVPESDFYPEFRPEEE